MAEVARRAGVGAAIWGAIGGWALQAGERALHELQDQLVNHVMEHGPQALQDVGNIVQEWGRHNVETLGNRAFHMAAAIQQSINRARQHDGTLGDEFHQMFGDDDPEDLLRQADDLIRENNVFIDNNGEIEDSTPDLQDLIPESDGMDTGETTTETVETLQARSSGGGPSGVSKETPISSYPSLSYGLPETHTCILPWTGYFSSTGMVHAQPNVVELRLTQPHDIMKTELSTVSAGASWTQSNNNVPFNNSLTRASATAPTFPSTITSGTYVAESATWWEYYRKLYEYYTILGCEYEIIIDNNNSTRGTNILVGWDYNAYNTTAGASGNITPQNQALATMKQYKQIKWIPVYCRSTENNSAATVVIRGRYKPGQARRNINNDGDVKTWDS